MTKRLIVISLGGSLIIPDKINVRLIEEFKKIILQNTKKYKFIIVCGGGNTARNYIHGLNERMELFQSFLGIAATRLNAKFMTYFFEKNVNQVIPRDMVEVENLLKKHDVVFCGALRYADDETSDATSAKLANHFNTEFINLSDVKGLYDKNPKRFKNAKFIPEISPKEFLKMANQIEFKPGQHFILDAKAAKIIKKHNIKSYLLGSDMKNLDSLLKNRHFVGTIIGI
ncbi:Uridylate kinase [uncultured archaeon]|nr:Uridylate kinase [uncultured archaeon]